VSVDVAFPYRIDDRGRTASGDNEQHVHDLVEQLLFTMPGERVMRPTLGSGLMQLVFQPNSEELATAVQFLVQANLQQWLGDVVTVEAVDVNSTESTIEIRVQYVVQRTGERQVAELSRTV
jgi:phage baseplate assembly protein W